MSFDSLLCLQTARLCLQVPWDLSNGDCWSRPSCLWCSQHDSHGPCWEGSCLVSHLRAPDHCQLRFFCCNEHWWWEWVIHPTGRAVWGCPGWIRPAVLPGIWLWDDSDGVREHNSQTAQAYHGDRTSSEISECLTLFSSHSLTHSLSLSFSLLNSWYPSP